MRPAPTAAAALLAEIHRLFQELRALPGNPAHRGMWASPAHRQKEAQIRALVERYLALEDGASRSSTSDSRRSA